MSPIAIASTVFKLISAVGGSNSDSSSSGSGSISGQQSGSDFASSLALSLASSQGGGSNAVNVLGGLANGRGAANSPLDFLSVSGLSDPISLINLNGKRAGLSAAGRNLSLHDPESAYRMMTDINNRDVTYKAQFSELSGMGDAVGAMQKAGRELVDLATQGDDATIKSALQSFVAKYNEWVGRYDGTVKSDGLLAGTQAAEVSLYELRQSIQNPFNGAGNGVHGLKDLGISIDPVTHIATLDSVKLDATLAHVREGALAAINEFGQNFSKSAELLVSANNFIPNRLANLDRAIHYISDNKSSLQAEFGLGDAPRSSASVSRALAAYNQMVKA